ncbi:hypothetical protein KBTX_04000 [wastewater metagenome]|uniref:Uncharacterized protein n=2 Tax=unclassified sequences TaxID=12908 RepID=A0A5B8RG80_9ZZZZ|nr:hypothetical protein KBTEX_04000 [uncultured organism]
MPALEHHLLYRRELRAVDAGQAVAQRAQVHLKQDAEVEQQRRNDARQHDLGVGHAQHLGHDEGRRAHDRRQDLAAHARRGLDCPGEFGTIAGALHQRDGERARGHHVGDRRAVDRAEKTAGDHGDLGRTAPGRTGDREREVVEQLPQPRLDQKGAEQDEQDDVARRYRNRRAQQPLGDIDQMRHDLARGREHYGLVEIRIQRQLGVEGIDQKRRRQRGQAPAGDAPRGVDDQSQCGQAHDHVDIVDAPGRDDHPVGGEQHVAADGHRQQRQHGLGQRQPVARALPGERVNDEGQPE